jgi:hypothetical protein
MEEAAIVQQPDHASFNGRCSRPNSSVQSSAMSRAKRQCWMDRFVWAMVVISTIALVLMLSIAITLDRGHSFDQIALALPIFVILLFLAVSTGGWLQSEDFFLELEPRLSASLTRGPPA